MTSQLLDCFRAFRELEVERGQVLGQLAGWPAECVCFRPSVDAWSAAEVLDHIVRSESGTIANVRVGLESPEVLGDEHRPRIAELDRALRSDRSFKVPVGAGIYPDVEASLPEVVMRWERARSEARELLEGLTPAQAGCGVFCHPFAGWMTFQEVLEHFSAHLYHHRFQLERIRAMWEARLF